MTWRKHPKTQLNTKKKTVLNGCVLFSSETFFSAKFLFSWEGKIRRWGGKVPEHDTQQQPLLRSWQLKLTFKIGQERHTSVFLWCTGIVCTSSSGVSLSHTGRRHAWAWELTGHIFVKVQFQTTHEAPWLPAAGFFSKPSLKSRNTIFTVGQRGAILSPAELEGPILVPHTAQRGDSRVRPSETQHNHFGLIPNDNKTFENKPRK